jgi:integrase
MKLQLTADNVRTLAPSRDRDEEIFWDTELEGGFGLRVRRRGGKLSRTYLVQYRFEGTTRRLKVGEVVRLTLNQAREQARKLLAQVTLGRDPQGEKTTKRELLKRTVRIVAESYIASRQDKKRPNTLYMDRHYLLGTYFAPFHVRGLVTISRADVAERVAVIARNHTPYVARLARKTLSSMCRWAMEMGYIEINPVIGTPQPVGTPVRERVLSDDELVAVWRACEPQTHVAERTSWGGNESDFYKIVRLLILTATRRGEPGGMRFSELDPTTGVWTIPGTRTKNHRTHVLPLPRAALDILATVPRGEHDTTFGYKGNPSGFTQWDKCKLKLDLRLGDTVKSWWLHDLRRTAATGMADIGVQPHIIEQILNHVSGHKGGVHGVYNRSDYSQQVKVALERWAAHVQALAEGRAGDNVTALRG